MTEQPKQLVGKGGRPKRQVTDEEVKKLKEEISWLKWKETWSKIGRKINGR